MNNIELKNAIVSHLHKQAKKSPIFPKVYTPKEVASAVDGYAPSVGKVADDVVSELIGRGIKLEYVKTSNPRKFIIYNVIKKE